MSRIIDQLRKINSKILKGLSKKLEEAAARQRALGHMSDRDFITYRVSLVSLWTKEAHSEGEKDVILTRRGALPEIIKKAEKKFKEVNHRSDVQAKYTVEVVFKNRTRLLLPEKIWNKFTEKH